MTAPKDGLTGNRLPVPDPTLLTTEALKREISSLREIVEAKIDSVAARVTAHDGLIEKRAIDIEKAVAHLSELLTERIGSLHDNTSEKFKGVQVQFAERDTRTEQTSRDSKVAVDAALQAAKEAVGEQNKSSALAIAKSEAATTKQIDQIGTIMNATTNGLNDKIDDLKSRVTAVESRSLGAVPASNIGSYIGVGAIVLAVILAVGIAVAIMRGTGAS